MKRVATQEDPADIAIPEVVSVAVVAIEPQLAVVVALHVPDVRVAIRVGSVQNAAYATVL